MMQRSKTRPLKASEILKNFSRNYHAQSYPPDDLPLNMKSRKVAFTSRIMHSTNRQNLKERVQPYPQEQAALCKKQIPIMKLPQNFLPLKEITQRQPLTKKSSRNQSPFFSFRSTGKNRLLSPKILKINVTSPRVINRSFSANSHRKYKILENPQSERKANSFQFTFGLRQQF